MKYTVTLKLEDIDVEVEANNEDEAVEMAIDEHSDLAHLVADTEIERNGTIKMKTALTAFIGHVGEISEKLAAIQEHIENHMGVSPDEVNWSHVGSAEKVTDDLSEIMEFLGLKKEGDSE